LIGCAGLANPEPEDIPAATTAQTALPSKTAAPLPTAAPTQEPIYLRVNANLPAAYRQSLQLDGSNIEIVSSGKTSAILDYRRGNPVSYWIYALAAPFPTITDEISAKT